MKKILVVDDERSIRKTFEAFLVKEGYEVFTAETVNLAMEVIRENEPDLIITDIIMPRVTGIELLRIINANKPDIPIVIMTGEPTLETATLALKNGACDYISKPVSKDTLVRTAKYAIERKELTDNKRQLEEENRNYRENLEELVVRRTISLEKAMLGIIDTITSVMEIRDPYTAGHERRAGNLAVAIAQKMNLLKEQVDCLYVTGYLHDIGKMAVPAEILAKPGKLTDVELAVIKTHSVSGYDILKGVEFPWPVAKVVLQHHELINGSGYPYGLKKDEMLIEARVMVVADVIEAMTSHRPYRAGLGLEAALQEIESKSGILYDEDVSSAALSLFRDDNYEFTDDAMIISLHV